MKKYVNVIRSGLIILTLLTIGLFTEYHFSILKKFKNYIIACQVPSNEKHKAKVAVEELTLILTDSALIELKTQRKKAIDGNREFSFMNARIVHKSDTTSIKLRLKGDREIHFNDETKWSFRVKTIGEKKVFDIKRFSLHRAGARNYIYEWIFHKALNSIDLIGLKYEFVRLKVGGCDLGIYAFEEHFENSLITNKGLPLGPILRFNEDYSLEDLSTTYVDPFEDKYWQKNDPELLQLSISNLEMWRRGKLKTSKVFNVEKLAKYFAVTDVLWMPHAQAWKSIRFYFNPNNKLLEPIGYDGHYNEYFFKNKMTNEVSATIPLKHFISKAWVDLYKDWYAFIFVNPETFDKSFYTNYIHYLKLYSQKEWLDQFFQNNDEEIKKRLSIIASDPSSFEDDIFSYGAEKFKYSKTAFYERAKYIQATFNKSEFIHAYPVEINKSRMTIEVENIGFYAVKIDRVVVGDQVSQINKIIIPHASNTSPEFTLFEIKCPKGFVEGQNDIEVHYHIIGDNNKRKAQLFKWKRKID